MLQLLSTVLRFSKCTLYCSPVEKENIVEHTIQHFFLRQKARHPFLLYYNAIHDDFFPFRKRRKGIAEKSCGFMLQPGLGIVVAGGAGTIYTGMVRHQINEKAAAAQTYSIDIVVVQYAMYCSKRLILSTYFTQTCLVCKE